MARIRFQGTQSSAIPTPPAGKASLFFDNSDNSLKLRLDDGSIIALGVSEEYIQDILGNMLQGSEALEIFYDDDGGIASINLKPSILNDFYVDKISPTKIIDDQNGRYSASIITNTDEPMVIFQLDCSEDGVWMIEARITCWRIGGTSGNPGDAGVFRRTFMVKSINSSVTVHTIQSDYTAKDNPSLNLEVGVISTDLVIKVIGDINNNFRWKADVLTNINT